MFADHLHRPSSSVNITSKIRDPSIARTGLADQIRKKETKRKELDRRLDLVDIIFYADRRLARYEHRQAILTKTVDDGRGGSNIPGPDHNAGATG